MSLNFAPKGLIDNNPLSEPLVAYFNQLFATP